MHGIAHQSATGNSGAIVIELPGEPRGKGRPRFARHTGHAYPRKQRLMPHDYKAARRALARIAVPVGHGGGSGRPMLWRLRNSGEE